MTLNTPIYGFPYPENTDAPNGPAQFNALATAVEAVLVRMDTQTFQRVYTATGVTVWNKPAGLKGIIVELQGGGGGSGGNTTTAAAQSSGAGGGKGGAYARFYLSAASVAAAENVTVGLGGTAGATAGGTGGTGGTSSFGAFGSAVGGDGGSGGGTAGTAGAITTQSGGTTAQAFSGTATNVLFVEGSDGGQGIRIANGTEAVIPGYGGAAHLSGMQKLATAAAGAIPPSAGQNYGGGAAAGGLPASTAGQAGAAGAQGIVVITEIY